MPVGTYVYGIADYGNIIAIASDANHVDKIWYVVIAVLAVHIIILLL